MSNSVYDTIEKLNNGRINLKKIENNKNRYFGEDSFMAFTYRHNGKKLYFKKNHYNNWNDYAEVLFYHIARKFDIGALEYKLADSGDHKGVVSEEFKKDNEREMHFPEFVIRTIDKEMEMVDFYTLDRAINYNKKYKFTEGKIETKKKLLSSILFDAVIMNDDRHSGNIVFLVDNKNNIRLAPLYDHGLASGMFKSDKYYKNNPSEYKDLYKIDENMFKYNYNSLNTIDDVFNLYKSNRNTTKTFFKKYYEMDFDQIIKDVESKENIVFPSSFKKYVSMILKQRRKTISENFKDKIRKMDNSSYKKEGLEDQFREISETI